MPAKKKPVHTPLHLLQQLSQSLLDHLQEACAQALIDAEKVLAKLEKQRNKAQEKLAARRLKLQIAVEAGKLKAQAKAKQAVAEWEDLLDTLQERQVETRQYIARLKQDTEESLRLAQGIGQVHEAAGRALAEREAPAQVGPKADKPVARARKTPAPSSRPAGAGAARLASAVHAATASTRSQAGNGAPTLEPAGAKPARSRAKPAALPTDGKPAVVVKPRKPSARKAVPPVPTRVDEAAAPTAPREPDTSS